MELPACRLVWVGNAIPAPGKWSGWHVEILVTSLTSPTDAPNLQVLAVPISVLGLLNVGRVLEDPSHERRPHSFGGPGPQLRFLGSEWTIDLDFGSPQTSIVSAADLRTHRAASAGPGIVHHAEAAAWWGAYRSGWVPGHESKPDWPDFAAEADERSRVRCWRLDAYDLARALEQALLAAPPAPTA